MYLALCLYLLFLKKKNRGIDNLNQVAYMYMRLLFNLKLFNIILGFKKMMTEQKVIIQIVSSIKIIK